MRFFSAGPNGIESSSYGQLIAQYQERELLYKLSVDASQKRQIEDELKAINSQLKSFDNGISEKG